MVRIFSVATAFILALAVTFALFYIMQLAIASALAPPVRGETIRIGDITIPEMQIEIQTVEPKPDEPEELEEIPDLPEEQFDVQAPTTGGLNIARVEVDLGGLDNNTTIAIGDSEMLPIVIINPQYPNRALQRGIEGWCHVSFTVTENGSVIDPFVVDSDPPNTFDNAALRAVGRFKYNPRMVDGTAVSVTGVQYVLRFEIDE